MTEAEQQLLRILKDRSFQTGAFRLASGNTSSYYIDGKMTEINSYGAYLIGEILYQRTKDLGVDAIGGLEAGAIPLATAAAISYYLHEHQIEGFWVRDEVKHHGTNKLIEGKLDPGARVVILDDVISTGGSVIKAVNAVRDIGCEVVQVIALVDRLAGARDLFRKHGIEDYHPVFTIRNLGVNS